MYRICVRRLLSTSLRWYNGTTTETIGKIANDIKGKSSCPVGTNLNLGIWKDTKKDPKAKADNEYPEWLWNVLSPQASSTEPVDQLSQRSKELRKLHRNQIKQSNYLRTLK